MLTSSFFSDGGTDLMRKLLSCLVDPGEAAPLIDVRSSWDAQRFAAARESVRGADLSMRCSVGGLREIQRMRKAEPYVDAGHRLEPCIARTRREFTDMLWSVFHLTDEFNYRGNLDELPAAHLGHLNEDAERALRRLLLELAVQRRHLEEEYPYLFAVAALEARPEQEDRSPSA